MPELIIKYKNRKTLEVLKDLAKYFNFSVEMPQISSKTENKTEINGVTILPFDGTIDTSELESIFSGKSINSKKLRSDAWLRNS